MSSPSNFIGKGSQMLKQQKRKREGDGEEEYPSKRTRDVGLIAGHCTFCIIHLHVGSEHGVQITLVRTLVCTNAKTRPSLV